MVKIQIVVFLLFAFSSLVAQGYKTLMTTRATVSDNKIFTEGKVLSYDCFVEYEGEKCKVCLSWEKQSDNSETVLSGWELCCPDDLECEYIVDEVKYIVPENNDDLEKTNRRQTEVKIEYLEDLPLGEYTGIVENDVNIWMHPPRSYFFKILNICPYPFVKFPIEVNDSWSDKMRISSYWSDSLWGHWDKKLHIDLHYKVDHKEKVYYSGDTIECYVINATSHSDLGVSQLCIYYNDDFGFVRLNYTVLDKFKIDFVLKESQGKK